jgi:hypothetical protein
MKMNGAPPWGRGGEVLKSCHPPPKQILKLKKHTAFVDMMLSKSYMINPSAKPNH